MQYFSESRPQYVNSVDNGNDWQQEPDAPNVVDAHNYADTDDVTSDIDDDCNGKLEVVRDWPKHDLKLGQIGGLDVAADGHPSVFHRADRTWESE